MDDRLSARVDRLDAYLDDQDLEAVWFARPNSFAWLTGGDNRVERNGEIGAAAAGYDGDLRVVTDNIEDQRLRDEQLPDAFEVASVPWYEASLAEAVADHSPAAAAADFDVPGFDDVDPTELRQPLTRADVEAYRELGREVAAAVESVCRELEPGDTERDAAAGLRIGLATRGIDAPVVLVGGAERAQAYRHYKPTDAELGDYALASVTAARNGLHVSVTRTVAFDPPEWLEARHAAATEVEVSALGATREAAAYGGTAGEVFEAVEEAYDRVGWAGEWQNHHQGGAAGYAGREWIATPDLDRPVHAPMAYAWNPTVQGAKSEDTVLVSEDGFEVLTTTGRWPTRTVESDAYDAAVERHEILHSE